MQDYPDYRLLDNNCQNFAQYPVEEIIPGAKCPGTIKHLFADWIFFRKGSKAVDQDDLEVIFQAINALEMRLRPLTTTLDIARQPPKHGGKQFVLRSNLSYNSGNLSKKRRSYATNSLQRLSPNGHRGKEEVALHSKGTQGAGSTPKSVSSRGP